MAHWPQIRSGGRGSADLSIDQTADSNGSRSDVFLYALAISRARCIAKGVGYKKDEYQKLCGLSGMFGSGGNGFAESALTFDGAGRVSSL